MRQRVGRNELAQYVHLADEWWPAGGALAALRWIAEARAALIPPASRPGAVLLDLGCGGGLLAPSVERLGYRHVGVDLVPTSLRVAAEHGVVPVHGDATVIPFADSSVDAVSAGELLEHVTDPVAVIREACRVLRRGGTLVLDTINSTALARFVVVTLGERVPGGPPKGIHDPRLFVRPELLVRECAKAGVPLTIRGLRPSAVDMFRWTVTRRGSVRMVPTWSSAVLYQGWGVKES